MSNLGRHGRNLSWMFFAEVVQKILALALFTYATRQLSLVENGWYGTYLALFAALVTIINAGFYDVAVRDLAQGPERVHGLISTAMTVQFVLGLIVAAAVWGGAWLLRYPTKFQHILTVGTFTAMLWSHIRMQYAVAAAREHFRVISVLNIVVRAVIVGVSLGLLYFGYGAMALVAALVPISGAHALLSYLALGSAGGRYRFQPGAADARYLLQQGFPIALGGIAATGYYSLDIPLLTSLGAPEAAAYYANAMRFFLLCLTLADLLASVTYPVLSRKANDSDEIQRFTLLRCLKASALAAVPLAVGGTVLASGIVRTLCGERYLPSAGAVAALMWILAGEMTNNILVLYLRAKMRQRIPAAVYVTALAAKVALSLALIPRFGLSGFLCANLGLSFMMTTALFMAVRRVAPSFCFKEAARTVYVRPALAALVMGGALWFLRTAPIVVSVPLGAVIYAASLWALGGFDEFDKRMFKGAVGA